MRTHGSELGAVPRAGPRAFRRRGRAVCADTRLQQSPLLARAPATDRTHRFRKCRLMPGTKSMGLVSGDRIDVLGIEAERGRTAPADRAPPEPEPVSQLEDAMRHMSSPRLRAMVNSSYQLPARQHCRARRDTGVDASACTHEFEHQDTTQSRERAAVRRQS